MGHYRWSRASDNYLTELVGDYPLDLIAEYFNRWANQHNERQRSRHGIEQRIRALGLDTRPGGLYMSLPQIAELTGRSRAAIRLWIGRGWLQPRDLVTQRGPQRNNAIWVHRCGLRALASAHPEAFSGVKRQELFLLLEHEDTVERVLEANAGRVHQERPVICLSTGERFRSAALAARWHRCSDGTILRACRTGRPTRKGLRFRAA